MILVGIGTGGDRAVSDSVALIQRSSNSFSAELHDAVRIELEQIVVTLTTEVEKRIFLVSHGSQSALLDASINRVPYLGSADVAALHNCYVFAHACSTGARLGKEAAKEAFVYFGFDAPISAPPASNSICFEDILAAYRTLAAFIQHLEYRDPHSVVISVQNFLDGIGKELLEIEAKYDTDDGSRLDAEEMICVRQFRADMCAWIKGIDNMLKAIGAPP